MAMTVIKVGGMTCEGCAAAVRKAAEKAAPDSAPKVDLEAGLLTVADGADIPAVVTAVERAGFSASPS